MNNIRKQAADKLISRTNFLKNVTFIETNQGHSIVIYTDDGKPVTFIRFAEGDDRWKEEAEFYKSLSIPHKVFDGQVFIASTSEIVEEVEKPME